MRLGGRLRGTAAARRELPPLDPLPGPVQPVPGGALLLPLDRPRERLTADLVAVLRRSGLRVLPGTGWEDYDALVFGSSLVAGELVTSGYPEGTGQMRVRPRLRVRASLLVLGWIVAVVAVSPMAGVACAALALVELARGGWRVTRSVRNTVVEAAG
jgi:hypothetical protein